MKVLDLTGQRFGKVTVVMRDGTSKDGQKTYLCRCDCGKEIVVKSGNLRSGHTKSCGCISIERIRERNKQNAVHGGSGTKLYGVWIDMRARCNFQKSINWHLYGGRGIKVCDEWMHDFASFRDWAMASGYEDGLQLDRIDNDGNYEPNNCKWSTLSEQGNNRRTCIYITINGETKTATEWCEITGVSRHTAFSRIRRGWDLERAVSEKAKPTAILSEKDVDYIREKYIPRDEECGAEALARKYKVSKSTIEAVLSGRNWHRNNE